MNKTAEKWFEEFPEPYRTQALNNSDESISELYPSAGEALWYSFIWEGTPEGRSYWHDYLDLLVECEFKQKLKEKAKEFAKDCHVISAIYTIEGGGAIPLEDLLINFYNKMKEVENN